MRVILHSIQTLMFKINLLCLIELTCFFALFFRPELTAPKGKRLRWPTCIGIALSGFADAMVSLVVVSRRWNL